MSVQERPRIAGLLITYNRADLLPAILEALARQSLPSSMVEIIIIDDGSHDETPSICGAALEQQPNWRYIRQDNAGVAQARNEAVSLAQAPIVIFLDDDDIADCDLFARHLAAHERSNNVFHAVLGQTDLAEDVASDPLMHHVTKVGCQLFSYDGLENRDSLSFLEFWGGRTSCRKEAILSVGGFDPRFSFGCEDIELAYRLRPLGLQVAYEPLARTTMIRRIGFRGFCQRSYRQGASQALFYNIHPLPDIRTYCAIDDAETTWPRARLSLKSALQAAERMDARAREGHSRSTRSHRRFMSELNDAYRNAFRLCMIKGVADHID